MLAMLSAWLILFLICGALGGRVLSFFLPREHTSAGTFFFLALWLGLLLWGNILLAVALLTPLTPLVGLVVLIIGGLNLGHHPLFKQSPSRDWWFAGALVALVFLPLGIQVITTHDSLTYHPDIISWLSRIGVVPGLALFHGRFGFVSSWFCLPALFDGPDLLQARMTAVTGSFAALLCGWQICWAIVQGLRARDRIVDRVASTALFLAMLVPVMTNLSSTPSQDVPAAVLVVLCFWTLQLTSGDGSLRQGLLPLLFAGLAVTVKLSTLPALIVCGLIGLAICSDRLSLIKWGGLLLLVVLAPWLIAQTLLSGWPFFPLGPSLDLVWTVPGISQQWEVAQIRAYAPWSDLPVLGLTGTIESWLMRDRTNLIAVGYLVAALLGGVVLWRRRRQVPVAVSAYGLGLAGTIFWLYTTAHPRFGWGFLAILPTALWFLPAGKRLPIPPKTSAFVISIVIVTTCFCIPAWLMPTRSERAVQQAVNEGRLPAVDQRWVLPPLLPAVRFSDAGTRADAYVSPIKEEDWLPLPNRPMTERLDPGGRIRLLDPDKGLRGGVVLK